MSKDNAVLALRLLFLLLVAILAAVYLFHYFDLMRFWYIPVVSMVVAVLTIRFRFKAIRKKYLSVTQRRWALRDDLIVNAMFYLLVLMGWSLLVMIIAEIIH